MKFREKSISKLYAFALAAVFALTLAGCGGGGGTAAVEEPPPMPDPQMECVDAGGRWNADMTCTTAEELAAAEEAMKLTDAQAAAQAAYNAAKAAVDAAEANRDSDPDSYDAAQRALGAAEAANSAAQAATMSGAAEAAQADAEAARDNAVAYAGMVNQAKADDDAAAATAAQAAANKVAGTKETAIAAEAAPPATLARPFDAGDEIAEDARSDAEATTKYELTVKHDGTMATVEVRDQRNLNKGDPKFSSVARFGDGQMLTRDIGSSREIIVLHTDIEAPTPTAFSKEHRLDSGDDPDTTATDNTSLTVNNTQHLAHVDLGISTPDEGAETGKEFTQDDGTTPGVDEGKHRGRFNGAMGTYECNDANCKVTINDKGKATEILGSWTFTPDSGAMVDVADADFMHYGFWLSTKTKDGAVSSYDTVQTFAFSSLRKANGTLDEVTGTAEYSGGAAGVYVHNTLNPDSTVAVKTSGRFTADVSLNVDFDGSTTRVPNSVQGSISNFELEHGESQNWNVGITAGIDSFDLTGGVASGMKGNNGSLSGQFHAPTDRDAADAPEVLVGEFNANFVNGSAAGAFGARLKD